MDPALRVALKVLGAAAGLIVCIGVAASRSPNPFAAYLIAMIIAGGSGLLLFLAGIDFGQKNPEPKEEKIVV